MQTVMNNSRIISIHWCTTCNLNNDTEWIYRFLQKITSSSVKKMSKFFLMIPLNWLWEYVFWASRTLFPRVNQRFWDSIFFKSKKMVKSGRKWIFAHSTDRKRDFWVCGSVFRCKTQLLERKIVPNLAPSRISTIIYGQIPKISRNLLFWEVYINKNRSGIL